MGAVTADAEACFPGPASAVSGAAGLDIESLELRPQELAVPRDASRRDDGEAVQAPLALFRMDFAARVRTPDGGQRQVLIEIQKTNAPTVVERFRAYLGQQLCSPANVIEHPSGRREAAPIVTIYLLGYDLGLSDEAVLDVCPRATERRTGAEIDAGHPFIAGIHHRSHVVQIPRLRGRRRDELERVLSIFDQGEARIERGGAQVLTIDESAYPPEYGFVLRQLQRAASESDVRRFMEGEDQLLRDSISWGRQADYERREKERESRRADRAERALSQALSRSIQQLHRLGQEPDAIARALSMDVGEVRRVLAASDDGKGSRRRRDGSAGRPGGGAAALPPPPSSTGPRRPSARPVTPSACRADRGHRRVRPRLCCARAGHCGLGGAADRGDVWIDPTAGQARGRRPSRCGAARESRRPSAGPKLTSALLSDPGTPAALRLRPRCRHTAWCTVAPATSRPADLVADAAPDPADGDALAPLDVLSDPGSGAAARPRGPDAQAAVRDGDRRRGGRRGRRNRNDGGGLRAPATTRAAAAAPAVTLTGCRARSGPRTTFVEVPAAVRPRPASE